MGYTHYWIQNRSFTHAEWKLILGETKRIIAKAQRGNYYTGRENLDSQNGVTLDEQGFRHGFNEEKAWRTFLHPEQPIPRVGEPILLAGPTGRDQPILNGQVISFNGQHPYDYESFVLPKVSPTLFVDRREADARTAFCKTEYRPYDAVVVSILYVARAIAPDALEVRSDGGADVIRYLF